MFKFRGRVCTHTELKERIANFKLRKFKCGICRKTYLYLSKLKEHMQVHFQPKFNCDKCPKQFHYKGNLKQHMMIHSGVKPFECNTCVTVTTHHILVPIHVLNHWVKFPHY